MLAKDKPMRRGTVGDQQQRQEQQQEQKVRRTAQTEKSNSLVSQGQQQQQQQKREQCMQQDALVRSSQESSSTIPADNLSKDCSQQETEDEACQEKAVPIPMPLVQVAISFTPADDPTPPLCSPPPVRTSPALIRRFLAKEVVAAASAPNAVAIAQPSMPKTTVALSSFETATLTQECTSTAAAWSPSGDQETMYASGALQQVEFATAALSSAALDPASTSNTTRPPIAPLSSSQLSAAQIMVSRIVEKNKRRRSLGDLVNIMSKKTRDYIPHARTNSSSSSGAHQQDTTAADTKSAGRRSLSETPCSPTHVSTLESFPKHSSTSSLRIQYLRDFFRSGSSTAAHARSASVAEVLIGRGGTTLLH
ncbi:hypothetical protein BGZ67_000623 [Mortierella alpina]|nr:hypothetical protein BGZ67_000623 [Mortierella alpina]